MLRIDRVTMRFPGGFTAIQDIELAVPKGEIVALVGPSGCGKSTLLRLIAGLERPTEGQIVLDGRTLDGPSPEIGVLFQEPRLMPWLDVAANVGFGLPRTLPREERRQLTRAAIERVGLTRFAGSLPKALSGGMAQRTALARALVTRPPVLLLDEPFSALDALTRASLHAQLLELWAQDRPTLLLVTHDLDEAAVLADRIIVLGGHPGTVQETVEVGLARPRLRGQAEVEALRQRLLDGMPAAFTAIAA